MPKRPKKLVIYLDQNFISEMSKSPERGVPAYFRELYQVLHDGFWNEKFVAPRSGFHDTESSLAGKLRQPIRERQSTLGHVAFRRPQEIKKRQVVRSVHHFMGREGGAEPIGCNDAFDRAPDGRLPHFDIDVDFDWGAGIKEQREDLRSQLEEARLQIVGEGRSYKQFDVEMHQSRADMLVGWMARECIALAKITEAEFLRFVTSNAFTQVPMVDLEVSLMARMMSDQTRTIKRGDVTDFDAMAAYLPYCHVYATDKGAAAIARSLKIDIKYDCQLFDSGRTSVRALIQHLDNARNSMAPVNVPHLSIFVAPTSEVKAHSWRLFQILGNKAKCADHDFGWWVELIGLDDGTMPSYRMRQVPHIPAPFYGLQDVLPRRCEPDISGDALLAVCRKLCRSTHFIIIDSFDDLDGEIVAGSAWAKERGEDRYLKWLIHPIEHSTC